MSSTRYIRGACKCCCNLGNVIPQWLNVTEVRTSSNVGGSCTSPVISTANETTVPASRIDTQFDEGPEGGGQCGSPGPEGNNCGICGAWLLGGDLLGISGQEVTSGINDIVGGGSVTVDHNGYIQTGTVDMRTSKLYGGQWVYAKKFWHGVLPWDSDEVCTPNPNNPPGQVRYVTYSVNANWDYQYVDQGQDGTNETIVRSGGYSGRNTVNSKSGIRTNTLASNQYNSDFLHKPGFPDNDVVSIDVTNGSGTISPNGTPMSVGPNYPIQYSTPAYSDFIELPQHAEAEFYCGNIAGFMGTYYASGFGIVTYDSSGIGTTHTFTKVGTPTNWTINGSAFDSGGGGSVSMSYYVTGTTAHYQITWSTTNTVELIAATVTRNYSAQFTANLSDPYTANDCYADLLSALEAWDMSNLNLAGLRTDEELANGPCLMYDEVGPTSPDMIYTYFTMDNGAGVQVPYQDPNNYYIEGTTLYSPMRSGVIIGPNQPGSTRHFWFGFPDLERYECIVDGTPSGYQWLLSAHGGYSDGNIPAVSTRWLDKSAAQYDGDGGCESPAYIPLAGNYPQAFWTQQGQTVVAGKYVAAVQTWPAVNRGRPCGPDKYAIDQTTVGCVTGAGSGYFTVTKPSTTTVAFPTSGYIAVQGSYGTNGIYPVTSVTGTGPWTVNVGAVLDSLPTGFAISTGSGSFLGWLRFPTASGICGRAPITTSYSAPTLTINTASQPYLRVGASGGISVDLYDSTMTLLASAVALTRVNDGQFTATAGPYPTAAYMTGHGVDYTKFNTTPQRTGVHLDWSFNLRLPHTSGYIPGSGYADTDGCTGCAITQFNYTPAKCLALVGIVPFYSGSPLGAETPTGSGSPPASGPLENFPNQTLFPMPDSVVFDTTYSAHWQGMVALTMPDPFWQNPFNWGCGTLIAWDEDNGSGEADDPTAMPPLYYYAHHPLVEAATDSTGLPSGVKVTYDPSNQIAPPFFPSGIPIGDLSGGYASIETDWGFAATACANILASGRFATDYMQFVSC